jgi:RND family efflux transporter MFP subunit
MIYPSRSVLPGFAALALGLLTLQVHAADGDDPPRKGPRPSKSAAEIDRFRSLEPVDRLKLVTKHAGTNDPFAEVKRGDLTTAVVERGAVEPADAVDLVCKVRARGKEKTTATTILWVIDDGTMVRKGERVAILDSSALKDELQAATARVKEAAEALEQAAENVRLARKEGAIEVRLAEIDLKLAEVELKELPAGKSKEGPELRVERAKLKLERASARAKAQQTQAEADRRAKAAMKNQEVERRNGIAEEIKHCTLAAPADGMVVYHAPAAGRFGGGGALIEQGAAVREGQKLLRVVGLKQFAVATRVHETVVSTLRVGQAAQVRVDAFPDKILRGKVQKISAVASQADWFATDTKVYPVTVTIDDPPEGLKPDMTVEVHIATGDRKAVLQVPRSAVVMAGGDPVCFVRSGQELVERKVALVAGNATSVEVTDGLKEGDLVVTNLPALLVRP